MARTHNFYAPLWSICLVALDFIALSACSLIAIALSGRSLAFATFTFSDLLLIAIICWIGLAIAGGYRPGHNMGSLRYFSEHILALGGVVVAAYLVTYVVSTFNSEVKPGRSVLLIMLALFTPLSLTYRYSGSQRAARNAASRFVYLLGTPEFAANLEEICRRARFSNPIRFINVAEGREFFRHAVANGSLVATGTSQRVFRKEQCDAVVVDLSGEKLAPEWESLLLDVNFHSVPVYPVNVYIETHFNKLALSYVTLSWALDGTFKPDHFSAYGRLKAVLDFLSAATLLFFLWPLMLLVAVAIKLERSGPVLFKQSRIGRFQQPFTLYKFRTMRVSGTTDPRLYTLKDDDRITRVGRFLRLTRLDELPQLWNVLCGQMSMIGPRAEWDKLVVRYEKIIPYYHLRHMVRPGITGWAQVNYDYGSSDDDTREKLGYDLYYIKHYSLQMDASIVLKTIFTILSASGR
jgi:exopolysaccharide biosynthesis polyprenyl glycosylphosphotransferase